MPMSYDSLVKTATMDYVARIRAGNIIHAEPEQYADELLAETTAAITAYNATHIGPKIKIPAKLENSQVAELVVALEPAARIACAGPNADASYDLIGVGSTDVPSGNGACIFSGQGQLPPGKRTGLLPWDGVHRFDGGADLRKIYNDTG